MHTLSEHKTAQEQNHEVDFVLRSFCQHLRTTG